MGEEARGAILEVRLVEVVVLLGIEVVVLLWVEMVLEDVEVVEEAVVDIVVAATT